MIATQSWRRLQRVVSLGSLALSGIGFAKIFGLGVLGIAGAAYVSYQAYEALKQDEADERNEIIAMRAAYLSHKLMISLGFVLLVTHQSPFVALLAVVCIGVLSEAVLRKLQGAAPHPHAAPAWAWWLTGIALLFFVGALMSLLMVASGDLEMSTGAFLWRLLFGR